MKNVKLIISFITILVIISIFKISYATDRFVDIPVPDNSTGFAELTLEEKIQQEENYEKKQAKVKENEMKKNKGIIIAIIVLVLIIGFVGVRFLVKKAPETSNKENEEANLEEGNIVEEVEIADEAQQNIDTGEVKEIQQEINSTADSDIYYVYEETGGRKILQVKPKVQFQVDLAGIIKASKPEESEIEELNQKAPNKTGIWVSEQSRTEFLKLLKKNNINEISIKNDGYLKIDKAPENEIALDLEKMINSKKLYVINITGIAYERDYVSGEIVEYPFEEMDPDQIIEKYEDGNKIILEVTTNKGKKISDEEILKEITLYQE